MEPEKGETEKYKLILFNAKHAIKIIKLFTEGTIKIIKLFPEGAVICLVNETFVQVSFHFDPKTDLVS